MHGISYRPTDLSLLKEFSKKKSVLKIFIILFEQDCPEAVVHSQAFQNRTMAKKCQFSNLNVSYLPIDQAKRLKHNGQKSLIHEILYAQVNLVWFSKNGKL